MPQLNNAQARIIDPVLTNVAQSYKHPDFIGTALFPRVPVAERGGKIVAFSKEDFMLYNTGRSPGQNTKRVQYGYSAGNYVLESHSLEGTLPIETMQEANAVPGIDASRMTIYKTQNIIALRLEKAQADVARTLASYALSNRITLSGTGQWSDFGTVSDPIAVVETAKEAVRRKIGKRPNTGVMGAAVIAALKQHPKVIDRMKYTGRDVPTVEILAALFGLDRLLVGDAIFADDAGNFSDVWGKDMVLAYTETGSLVEMGAPSYGYTYQLAGYPLVEEPYYERNPKSWIYPVTDEVAPVMAGADAGYLIQNAVA
jgi:hypothetical protein